MPIQHPTYALPLQSANTVATKQAHDTEINRVVTILVENDQDLNATLERAIVTGPIVGEWDAGTGAFPTLRPTGEQIRVGDTWRVIGNGTVDGQAFYSGDYLQAITAGGGVTFNGNWARAALGQIEADRIAAETAAASAQAYAEMAEFTRITVIASGDGTATPITLPISVDSALRVQVFVNMTRWVPGDDYTVSGDQLSPVSPLVWPEGDRNLLILIDRPFDSEAPTADDITIDGLPMMAVLQSGGPGVTRANLVALVAAGWTVPDGQTVTVDGLTYRAQAGATAIADLPGWVPHGTIAFRHFGAAADGITDDLVPISAASAYARAQTLAVVSGVEEGATLIVDGEGLQYALSDTVELRGEAVTYENATFIPTAGWVDTVPLVVVASGQSNMRGNPGATGGTFKSNSRVFAWLATTSGGAGQWVQNPDFANVTYWIPGSATVTLGGGVNNLALALAHRMQEASNRDVRLIIECQGNQNISEWIDSGVSSTRFAALEACVTEALATLSVTNVDIFLWQQGENNSGDTASDYAGKLTTLLTQLQGRSWWRYTGTNFESDTVFLAGEPFYGNASYDSVKEGIWQFYRATPKGSVFFAQADGLTDAGDNIHYDGPSLFELGYRRYFKELLGAPFVWAKSLISLPDFDVGLRNVKIEPQLKCGGVWLRGSFARVAFSEVTGHLSHGIAIPSIGGGGRRVTNCTLTGLPNGNPLFSSQDNWTSRNILSSNADTKIDEVVCRWAGVNISHTHGGTTTIINASHVYNGGSSVFVPVDTINIWARGSGLTMTGGYIDNGMVIIEGLNQLYTGCVNLAAPDKANLSAFFLLRSRTNTEPRGVQIVNQMPVSPFLRPSTAAVPKIPHVQFKQYAGWTWPEGIYETMNTNQPDTWSVEAGKTIMVTSNGGPALELRTGNAISTGTRLQLRDADTTAAPLIRSAGNGLVLSTAPASGNIIRVGPGSTTYTFTETNFNPPGSGAALLGQSGNRWASAHITQINYGVNVRPFRGGTDVTPNGVISGSPGAIYVNQDAPTWAQAMFVKIAGAGSSGWGVVQVSTPPRTVAALPSAATAGAGARGWVTDSNQTHTAGVGAVVTGGGANFVPVYSDGTDWRIG